MSTEYFSQYPFIVQDKNARSLSFFCKREVVSLSRDVMNELKKIASEENKDIRVSMHQSPSSDLHNMIILQHKGTYVRPHKHLIKAEAYQLIEGTQSVLIFDEAGNVIDKCHMSLEGNFLYRFEKNYYHMSIPTSDFVIFHESKIGPFVREGDSIFAPWAPSGDNKESIKIFMDNLLRMQPGI
jgi:cupin fold WbuC family metalloprotein